MVESPPFEYRVIGRSGDRVNNSETHHQITGPPNIAVPRITRSPDHQMNRFYISIQTYR